MGYAIALGKELHGLGSFHDVAFDYEYILQSTRNAMSNPNWFCRIVNDDNEWRGIMVGYVDTFLFSPQLLATECMLYVREGKSRAKLAMMLVRAFVSWALDDRGATHVQTGDVASINSTAVDALYRRLGFERFGIIYKYSRPGSVV